MKYATIFQISTVGISRQGLAFDLPSSIPVDKFALRMLSNQNMSEKTCWCPTGSYLFLPDANVRHQLEQPDQAGKYCCEAPEASQTLRRPNRKFISSYFGRSSVGRIGFQNPYWW